MTSYGVTPDAVGEHLRADRRLISLTVPRGVAPSAPPAALAEVVRRIETGDGSVVWRLDLARVFETGDHQAAPRFAQWISSFSTRVVLAESWVTSTLGKLLNAAGHADTLSRALADAEFVALGPEAAAELVDSIPVALDVSGQCFGLVNDDSQRIIPGRLWVPQHQVWDLSRTGDSSVSCSEAGVGVMGAAAEELSVELSGVTSWELAEDGLDVETQTGFRVRLSGAPASLLAAQAPGALSVRVAAAPASVGVNSLLRKLRSAAELASERGRYLLIGSDLPQSGN